jgi:lipopolysaccharide biosynthesis glycosyltransferase
MKKNVILNVSIGAHQSYTESLKTIGDYAKKCDADHYILNHSVINKFSIYFEKFFFVKLLEDYERVLYIDTDVLITPFAKNIFEEYPDVNKFYAYHENDFPTVMDRDYCIKPLLDDTPNWPNGKNGKLQYFNAGVFLVSNKYKNIFENFLDVPNLPTILNFGDQTYLNYLIAKNNVPFESIDYSFNRMNLGKRDDNGERFNANFIHYAGIDTYGNGNKLQTIKSDYIKLYGE